MDITFSSSAESVTGVRFNPSEPSVLASVGSDRTFILYDIRTGKAERRIVMQVYIQRAWLLLDLKRITDEKQRSFLVSYLPNLYTSSIGRSQSLHIRHPAAQYPHPDLQGTCFCRDIL